MSIALGHLIKHLFGHPPPRDMPPDAKEFYAARERQLASVQAVERETDVLGALVHSMKGSPPRLRPRRAIR